MSGPRVRRSTIPVVLVAVLAAGPAAADDGDASEAPETLAARGAEAYDRGDYPRAIELFQRARQGAPRFVCNIGTAYYQIDDLPRAHYYLSACLALHGAVPAAKREQVRSALAYVERNLETGAFGIVALTAEPAGARLTMAHFGDEPLRSGERVWLPEGAHRLVASAAGHADRAVALDVQRGRVATAHLVLERVAATAVTGDELDAARGTSAVVAGRARSASDEAPPGGQLDARSSPSRTPAWVALGTGAAALAGGAYFHLRAVDVRDELEGLPLGERRDALVDDLRRERTLMAGLYAAGALATGVGIYLWLRADSADGATPVSVAPVPGGAMAWLRLPI